MKSLKVLFAALVLVVSVMACSPSDEDVAPDQNAQQVEKFDVKSDESGSGTQPGGK